MVYRVIDKISQKKGKNDLDIKKTIYSIPPRISARIIAAILALVIALVFARIFASIEFTDEEQSPENETEEIKGDSQGQESVISSQLDFTTAATVGTVIGASKAVLFSPDENKITAQKDMLSAVAMKEATVFMFSLTVMKAVSQGRIGLSDEAVCPASAAKSPGYSMSSQVLPIGKRMAVCDILKCMLYQSGTSYAYTLAVHISGSTEAFTAEMQQYAAELGITDAAFTSCIGENDDSAVISTYSFAIIMKHFLANSYLKELFCSSEILTVKYGSTSIELVIRNDFFESFCSPGQASSDGVKGGKVSKSGYMRWACVVFENVGRTYVAAVFESEDPFSDALMLYSAYALCA